MMKNKNSFNNLQVSDSKKRLNETQQMACESDLLAQSPMKKSKTPGRTRGSNVATSKDRNNVMAQKLRQSVFKLTRDEEDKISR